MWNAFRGALAVLTRKTELAVWALIFPIILSTLFMFMFANLDESTAFEAVPTAVVADDVYRADEGFSTDTVRRAVSAYRLVSLYMRHMP